MKKRIVACLCTTILLAFSLQLIASESNYVTISVSISPSQAQAVPPVRTNWNIELLLLEEIDNGNTIQTGVVSRDGQTANSYGKYTWQAPIFKPKEPNNSTRIRYYYKVVCLGGWAYNDNSSEKLDAGKPNVYEVNIYMSRK